jgi:hypothetical protein
MASPDEVSVAAGLVLAVPRRILENHSAASPRVVGEELAGRVQGHVQRTRLGYYPALDYCEDVGAVPSELMDAVDSIAWLARELAREEVLARLSGSFSRVRLDALRCVAYTLPPVRPTEINARERLTRHFTPDRVRVGVVVAMDRERAGAEGSEAYARGMLWRWLKDRFSALEVTGAQVL